MLPGKLAGKLETIVLRGSKDPADPPMTMMSR
jgi:hypothetical protein